jgi:hypothetical protein
MKVTEFELSNVQVWAFAEIPDNTTAAKPANRNLEMQSVFIQVSFVAGNIEREAVRQMEN